MQQQRGLFSSGGVSLLCVLLLVSVHLGSYLTETMTIGGGGLGGRLGDRGDGGDWSSREDLPCAPLIFYPKSQISGPALRAQEGRSSGRLSEDDIQPEADQEEQDEEAQMSSSQALPIMLLINSNNHDGHGYRAAADTLAELLGDNSVELEKWLIGGRSSLSTAGVAKTMSQGQQQPAPLEPADYEPDNHVVGEEYMEGLVIGTSSKRNGAAGVSAGSAAGSLWSCHTEFSWRNLGPNYYPQFVRTATCSPNRCFNSFFQCAPVTYNVQVLKKLSKRDVAERSGSMDSTGGGTTTPSSAQLPSSVRDTVKFVNISVNTYCECRLLLGLGPSSSSLLTSARS